jgi:hypothetical protein
MSEEIKDVNAKIDEAEATVKKYASKDTVISIGGYEFTPAKLMVAATLVSSILGGLYGCFEVYKDYQGMKKRIAEYVAPDLSVFDKRLAVVEENSQKSTDYTRDIKNDLKADVRRLESVVEGVERSAKQSARESDIAIREVQSDLRKTTKELEQASKNSQRDTELAIKSSQRETEQAIRTLNREVDSKIQKAMDNPLSGK